LSATVTILFGTGSLMSAFIFGYTLLFTDNGQVMKVDTVFILGGIVAMVWFGWKSIGPHIIKRPDAT
jgi:hypothetical protein